MGGIQQQSNNDVTAQLEYFCDFLTVLLEYIDLCYALSHFLQVFTDKRHIVTCKQLDLACL